MRLSKRIVCVFVCAVLGAVELCAQWKPDKPITIIVPWSYGGGNDFVTTVIADELGKALGVSIIKVNMPGGAGTTGTKNVLDAPRDGYTWASGTADDLALYKVLGRLDTDIQNDWEVFLSIGYFGIVGVNADSKYKSFSDLLADFKANPGKIGVAIGREYSEDTFYMELIKKHAGINYKPVIYDFVGDKIDAVVSGEVMVAATNGQAKMIKEGKIRPLAAMADTDFNLQGYGVIPSVRKWIPELKIGMKYYGIFIPKGVPKEVIDTVTDVWNKTIPGNPAIQRIANAAAGVLDPSSGQAAQGKARGFYQHMAWYYHDIGLANVLPDTVGIPRP